MRARREGIFEIDLQLRPYGKAGSLAVSLESFRRYFAPGGPAWAYERQALVQLRTGGGMNEDLGDRLKSCGTNLCITGETFDVDCDAGHARAPDAPPGDRGEHLI